jgi:hypothetical protein
MRAMMRCTGLKKRWNVLIVEDDALVAWSIDEVLSLLGFEVVGVATNVGDALRIAEEVRPDLAIFDVRLSGRRDGMRARPSCAIGSACRRCSWRRAKTRRHAGGWPRPARRAASTSRCTTSSSSAWLKGRSPSRIDGLTNRRRRAPSRQPAAPRTIAATPLNTHAEKDSTPHATACAPLDERCERNGPRAPGNRAVARGTSGVVERVRAAPKGGSSEPWPCAGPRPELSGSRLGFISSMSRSASQRSTQLV